MAVVASSQKLLLCLARFVAESYPLKGIKKSWQILQGVLLVIFVFLVRNTTSVLVCGRLRAGLRVSPFFGVACFWFSFVFVKLAQAMW